MKLNNKEIKLLKDILSNDVNYSPIDDYIEEKDNLIIKVINSFIKKDVK